MNEKRTATFGRPCKSLCYELRDTRYAILDPKHGNLDWSVLHYCLKPLLALSLPKGPLLVLVPRFDADIIHLQFADGIDEGAGHPGVGDQWNVEVDGIPAYAVSVG